MQDAFKMTARYETTYKSVLQKSKDSHPKVKRLGLQIMQTAQNNVRETKTRLAKGSYLSNISYSLILAGAKT